MSNQSRRTFLKVLGGGAAAGMLASPLYRAIADPAANDSEFFVFVHASGGWDVTLWADPRNERKGIIEPASTATIDTQGLKR
ncbi:MAG: twin-arginine translocation signal domain-containing protein [Polyangiales bacterium]